MKKVIFFIVVLLFSATINAQTKKTNMSQNLETAILANGCFWCTEAVFELLEGVESVTSGYTGGKIKNPTYREIGTGTTEHAEAIEIKFNPKVISFQVLLEVFFSTHDPTTLNRQGYDRGTQYRSAIFYLSESQKETAEKLIALLTEANVFKDPIVTEVTEFSVFYEAENYHQDYYINNKSQGYCIAVINPKLEKFMKNYSDKLKKQ